MPIISFCENLLSLKEVAKLIPSSRKDGRLNPATVWRWAKQGVRTKEGQLVQLETVRLGMALYSSREAVERFLEAINPTSDPSPQTPSKSKPQTPAARRKRAEAAARELERMGA